MKAAHPSLRVGLQVETSDVLIDRLAQGKLDMVVGRLFARHDKSDLRYEALVEEPIAAVVRPGHPLMEHTSLTLAELAMAGWIVPPAGSVLRHRFELMFQEEGLPAPNDLIETTALLFMTKMLEQSDLIGVVASDVALYYQEHGLVAILQVELPCKMDAFGLITRTDRLLAPAAQVMLRAIKAVAHDVYGSVAGGRRPRAEGRRRAAYPTRRATRRAVGQPSSRRLALVLSRSTGHASTGASTRRPAASNTSARVRAVVRVAAVRPAACTARPRPRPAPRA